MSEVTSLEAVMVSATTTAGIVFSPLKCICATELIVLTPLGFIRQDSHSLIDSFKSIICFRRRILIRVHLQAFLSVRLLKLIIVCTFVDPKHLVVVFAAQYLLRNRLLLWCKLPDLRFDFGSFGSRRTGRP